MPRVLALFAKAPRPGAVKTRLCPPLTPQLAASLYDAMLGDVIAQAALRRDASLALWFDPPSARSELAARTPAGFELQAQRGPDLGARLAAAFRHHASRGFDRILIRGTDSPTLPAARIDEAYEALESCDAVVCPDLDGGYNLIGLRAPHDELFQLEMSTESVLFRTRECAARAGLDLRELPGHHDVDEAADLPRLLANINDGKTPRTAAWLRTHREQYPEVHQSALVRG